MRTILTIIAVLMLAGNAIAQKDNCKPDIDGTDKVLKTTFKAWGHRVFYSNIFSNMINTSQWSVDVQFGRFGNQNAIKLFLKKKEDSAQNAAFESKIRGEVGKDYYFSFSGDEKPVTLVVQHTSVETKTDNEWGGLVTRVTLVSLLTDDLINEFYNRFNSSDFTSVRLILADNIQLDCPAKAMMSNPKEGVKKKFLCFYDYNANNKIVAPEEVEYNDLPPNPNVPAALPRDAATGKVSFSDVVTVDGTSKDQLFKRARTWMVNYYKNEQFAINNKEDGRLTREGMFTRTYNSANGKSTDEVFYTISLSIRDGKYKYEITDMTRQHAEVKKKMTMEQMLTNWEGSPKFTRYINQQLYEGVDEVVKSFKAAMLTDPKSDW